MLPERADVKSVLAGLATTSDGRLFLLRSGAGEARLLGEPIREKEQA